MIAGSSFPIPPDLDLEAELAAVLGVPGDIDSIIEWNDVPGRTKEEATAALRTAAERAR